MSPINIAMVAKFRHRKILGGIQTIEGGAVVGQHYEQFQYDCASTVQEGIVN
jgi:hypothetical protein